MLNLSLFNARDFVVIGAMAFVASLLFTKLFAVVDGNTNGE